jgi:hypothetical protein
MMPPGPVARRSQESRTWLAQRMIHSVDHAPIRVDANHAQSGLTRGRESVRRRWPDDDHLVGSALSAHLAGHEDGLAVEWDEDLRIGMHMLPRTLARSEVDDEERQRGVEWLALELDRRLGGGARRSLAAGTVSMPATLPSASLRTLPTVLGPVGVVKAGTGAADSRLQAARRVAAGSTGWGWRAPRLPGTLPIGLHLPTENCRRSAWLHQAWPATCGVERSRREALGPGWARGPGGAIFAGSQPPATLAAPRREVVASCQAPRPPR